MPKLTYYSTTIVLIFAAAMLFNLLQMPIGMDTYYFQASSVALCPNPFPDPLSPLYIIIRLRKLFYWILLFAATRKEYHSLAVTVFELLPFKIWAQIRTKRENPIPRPLRFPLVASREIVVVWKLLPRRAPSTWKAFIDAVSGLMRWCWWIWRTLVLNHFNYRTVGSVMLL